MAISVCPSLCVSSFFASGGKTVRGICTKFSGCTDPPGGCVFLSFAGVHIARGACHMHVQATSELWILRACRSDVATQERKTLSGCAMRVVTCFLYLRRRGTHSAPARGIERISGDLRPGDSHQRTVRATGTKIGVQLGHVTGYQHASPLLVLRHRRVREHVLNAKGVQIGTLTLANHRS